MRIWFSGPRILGGLVRPGVSFGREDWGPSAKQRLARAVARAEVIKLAKDNGEDIDRETADLMLDLEIERQRAAANAMSIWCLVPIIGGGLGFAWLVAHALHILG